MPVGVPVDVLIVIVADIGPVTKKLDVTPVGKPDTLKITVPLKPFTLVAMTARVVLAPGETVAEAGVTLIEKSAPDVTTSDADALLLGPLLVPVTVMVPDCAPVVVPIVIVDVAEPFVGQLTDAGLKVALAPEGVCAERLTAPPKPFAPVTVTV